MGSAAPFTMPDETLEAFYDHGEVPSDPMPAAGGHAGAILKRFAEAGVDVRALASRLQRHGATTFVNSWNELMSVIDTQSSTLA